MKEYYLSSELKERLISYLTKFVENKGVSGNANKNIALAKTLLDSMDVPCKVISHNGVNSLLTDKSKIILNSHVDVVPGKESQFKVIIKDGKLFGRGSSDALGCAVGLLVAVQELHRLGKNVTLMLVSDEETGGRDGTKHVLENEFSEEERKNIAFAIVGEPTQNFGFNIREKGILKIGLTVNGKVGHVGSSALEDNPIRIASQIIDEIDRCDLATKKSGEYERVVNFNPVIIKGGEADNVIAESVKLKYNIRFAHNIKEEEIISFFEGLKKKYNFTFEILSSRPASYTDTDNYYFKRLANITQADHNICSEGSDLSYFSALDIPGTVYGVQGDRWHTHEEYVDIESLYRYTENIINFILEGKNGNIY